MKLLWCSLYQTCVGFHPKNELQRPNAESTTKSSVAVEQPWRVTDKSVVSILLLHQRSVRKDSDFLVTLEPSVSEPTEFFFW